MKNTFHQVAFLKDDFDPLVEARLTNVVERLRADWIANIAGHWTEVHTVNEIAVGDLEKRITSLLRESFFNYSQLLAGFEVLLLQIRHLRLVREKSLLGLEKLGVGLSDQGGQLAHVAQVHCPAQYLFCGCQSRGSSKE